MGNKHTSSKTIASIAIWLVENKATLANKQKQEIVSLARERFNGEFLTEHSVLEACEAAGISPRRNGQGRSKANRNYDRVTLVARVALTTMQRVELAIGAKPGSLLTQAETELLTKIINRESLDREDRIGHVAPLLGRQ